MGRQLGARKKTYYTEKCIKRDRINEIPLYIVVEGNRDRFRTGHSWCTREKKKKAGEIGRSMCLLSNICNLQHHTLIWVRYEHLLLLDKLYNIRHFMFFKQAV